MPEPHDPAGSPDAVEPLEEWEILGLLNSLADKSLVHRESGPDGDRYALMETVREYARDRMVQRGDAPGTQERFREYYTAWVAEADPEGPDAADWLHRLEREHDNLRKALAIALGDVDDRRSAQRLTGKLHWFWDTRAHLVEGRRWCESALRNSAAPTAERAATLQGAGNLAHSQADYRAAEGYHTEALRIRRELGDVRGAGRSLGSLAKAALNLGDIARAERLFSEALAANREAGDQHAETATLINYGILLGGQGEHKGAKSLFEAARRLCLVTGNQRMLLYAVSCLATEAYYAGEYEDARRRHLEALRTCRALGDRINIAYTLEGLGAVEMRLGQCALAARCYGAAERLRLDIGAPPRPANREAIESDLASLKEAMGEEEFGEAFEGGRSARLGEVLAALGS